MNGPTLLRLWSHLCTVLEKGGRDQDGMAGGGHWAEHRRKGGAQLKCLAQAVHALQATLRDTCAQLWERQQELREAIMAKSSHFTERVCSSRPAPDLLSQAQSEPLRSRLDPMDRE